MLHFRAFWPLYPSLLLYSVCRWLMSVVTQYFSLKPSRCERDNMGMWGRTFYVRDGALSLSHGYTTEIGKGEFMKRQLTQCNNSLISHCCNYSLKLNQSLPAWFKGILLQCSDRMGSIQAGRSMVLLHTVFSSVYVSYCWNLCILALWCFLFLSITRQVLMAGQILFLLYH